MNLPVRHQAELVVSPPESSVGMVARVKRRILDAPRAVVSLPGTAMRMSLKLQASVAEFLLVSRLRVHNQPKSSPRCADDVIKRGAQIVEVTCQSWFATAEKRRSSTAYRTRI